MNRPSWLRPFSGRGLDRTRRVYDWWSRHDRAYAAFVSAFLLGRTREFRERTVAALELEAGDRVLDVGCGPGTNAPILADAVGPRGAIVGVDASRGMVASAGERGAALPPETAVLRADASRLPVRPARFDAAIATLSLSAMSDVRRVLEGVHSALRPGGRLSVLDTRGFPTAPWRWLNPPIGAVAAVLTNWYPDVDVPGAVERTFADATIETFQSGSVFVLTATKGQ